MVVSGRSGFKKETEMSLDETKNRQFEGNVQIFYPAEKATDLRSAFIAVCEKNRGRLSTSNMDG